MIRISSPHAECGGKSDRLLGGCRTKKIPSPRPWGELRVLDKDFFARCGEVMVVAKGLGGLPSKPCLSAFGVRGQISGV
jgi:hypothetical protein